MLKTSGVTQVVLMWTKEGWLITATLRHYVEVNPPYSPPLSAPCIAVAIQTIKQSTAWVVSCSVVYIHCKTALSLRVQALLIPAWALIFFLWDTYPEHLNFWHTVPETLFLFYSLKIFQLIKHSKCQNINMKPEIHYSASLTIPWKNMDK